MKRVIAFSGMKGGVGRSTLCNMYAKHLKEKGFPVQIIRFEDFEEYDRELKNVPVTYFPTYYEGIDYDNLLDSSDGICLIDCKYYKNDYISPADTIVVPFNYNRAEILSTNKFLKEYEDLDRPFVFIPNRVRYIGDWSSNEDYRGVLHNRVKEGKAKGDAITRYSERGYITREILDSDEVQKWDFSDPVPEAVTPAFKDLDIFLEFLFC